MRAPACQLLYCTTELFKILYCKIEKIKVLIFMYCYVLLVFSSKKTFLSFSLTVIIYKRSCGGKSYLYCNIQTGSLIEHILKWHEMDLLFIFTKAWCFLPYLCSAFTVPTISTTRKIFRTPFVHPHPSIFSKIMSKFYLLCKFPLGILDSFNISFFELYLNYI